MRFLIFIIFIFNSINSFSEKIYLKIGWDLNSDSQRIVLKNLNDSNRKAFIPKPIGRVNDFEKIFLNAQINELDSLIQQFEKSTGNQIAIVSISTIYPYEDFFTYSLDLFNTWGIGQKELDNGLLIIISKNLRQVRITTGIGTESFLPDGVCKKILDEKMIPNFKNNLLYEGIKYGLLELIVTWGM